MFDIPEGDFLVVIEDNLNPPYRLVLGGKGVRVTDSEYRRNKPLRPGQDYKFIAGPEGNKKNFRILNEGGNPVEWTVEFDRPISNTIHTVMSDRRPRTG